jgi:hypothetical protein
VLVFDNLSAGCREAISPAWLVESDLLDPAALSIVR